MKENMKDIKNGVFYTPPKIVKRLYQMLKDNNIDANEMNIIDLAAGEGSLLMSDDIKDYNNTTAFDIDGLALNRLKENKPEITIFQDNSLSFTKEIFNKYMDEKESMDQSIKRKESIKKKESGEKIRENLIICNPPYNDSTSFYQKGKKVDESMEQVFKKDLEKYKSKDMGHSFLKMIGEMEAKFVILIHPLSYLIKKGNFNKIKTFTNKYKLIDSYVFKSSLFENTSKNSAFPIILGLYELNQGKGPIMTYEDIVNYNFNINDELNLNISRFDFKKGEYDRYPNLKKFEKRPDEYTDMKFFTLRDNNALIRNATYIKNINSGTVFIKKDQSKYYEYINNSLKPWLKDSKNIEKAWIFGNLSQFFIKNWESATKEDIDIYVNEILKNENENEKENETEN